VIGPEILEKSIGRLTFCFKAQNCWKLPAKNRSDADSAITSKLLMNVPSHSRFSTGIFNNSLASSIEQSIKWRVFNFLQPVKKESSRNAACLIVNDSKFF